MSTTTLVSPDRLREIVGKRGILPPERFTVHGMTPAAAVAPDSADAAAEVLRLASDEGWRVELAGSGSCLGWGRAPASVDLVVSASRLDGIDIYEPDDLTITLGAGIAADTLSETLRKERQWLAVETTSAGSTLGAALSGAAAGPLRLGYGTPRDQALGLRLVTGDGRVLDLGGRVVKNVAGYDLVKLVIGSRGTLGLITRASLRLRALPEVDRTLRITAGEVAPLLDLVATLRAEALEPVAMELLSPGAAAQVEAVAGGHADEHWVLLLRFHGGAAAVADAGGRSLALRGGAALDAGSAAAAWAGLRKLDADAAVEIRIADIPARLGRSIEVAESLGGVAAEGYGQHVGGSDSHSIISHAGDGIVRLHLPALSDRLPAAIDSARSLLAADGGTVVIARAPASLTDRIHPWGDAGGAAPLMRALRAQFDPLGILSAGRFAV